MKMRILRCLLGLILFPSFIAVSGEEPMQTVIYPILVGDPDAMETISRSIVGEEGHLVLDRKGMRLIVVTTPSRHARLNEIMGEADAKTGNVQINVRFRSQASERDRALGVKGDGSIVVGPGGTSGKIVIQPEVRDTLTETSGDTIQMLLVASGREGYLRVGESVPYIDWISEYSWRGGYTESRIQWQEAGSFLVVTPIIMGDGKTIHIRLTPEIRGMVDGNPFRMKYAALSTEVMVQDGQTIPLGGSVQNQEFYSRFLIGVSKSGVQSSLDIDLTPKIIPAGSENRPLYLKK